MIVFDLRCDDGHAFEGWFDSADAFERQRARGLLECPMCGIKTVTRLPSAPRLNFGAAAPAAESATSATSAAEVVSGSESRPSTNAEVTERTRLTAAQTAFYRHLQQMLEKSDNVGDRFAEEARRIHYKETTERQIHGVATREETVELLEEGIAVLPMPFGVKRKEELN